MVGKDKFENNHLKNEQLKALHGIFELGSTSHHEFGGDAGSYISHVRDISLFLRSSIEIHRSSKNIIRSRFRVLAAA